MARPSMRPGGPGGRPPVPASWVKAKPWPSALGFSTTNSDSPRWPRARSGSVRASSNSTSARAANVHQVLTPLIVHPPSTGAAEVVTLATSEPKSGSVTATAPSTSAPASFGSHCCFCSSVPPWTMARVRISGRVMSDPPAPSDAHESSSVATTMPR